MKSIFFWVAIGIVAWLGLRNLITIIIGHSRMGPLKLGQRLCHATSLLLHWSACFFAIFFRIWWPLVIGVCLEYLFRKATIKSGELVSRDE